MATAGVCAVCKKDESSDKKMRTHLLAHFSGAGAAKTAKAAKTSKTAKAAKTSKTAKAAKANGKDAYLVVVSDTIPATFWLYIRAHKTATLMDIDALIRTTWVECCGHLSAFRSKEDSYMVMAMEGDDPGTKTMEENAAKALAKSRTLEYEYDFGTPTMLAVRAAGACSSAGMKRTAEVVARNSKLVLDCGTCGAKGAAALICPECVWGDQSPLLCKKCAKKHEHEGEPADTSIYLPVVNSPRMGMCGYTG